MRSARQRSPARRERAPASPPPRPHPAELAGRAPCLGAHVSVAGGMPRALAGAAALGCTAFQVFVKNQHRWRGRELAPGEAEAFRAARAGSAVRHVLAHASYLVNLASPDDALFERSRGAMCDEMRRCAALGIPHLVVHPGAHVGSGEAAGQARLAAGLRWLLAQSGLDAVSILLECTAGQGTCLGHRFEHLARAVADAGSGPRLGVCIDTCHLFAAGADLRTPKGYEEVCRELESVVGLARVRAFHLNDSRAPLGARVDRHAGIGAGHLGRGAFVRLVRDARFAGLPMVLETPDGMAGYRRELLALRRMLRGLESRS